MSVHWAGRQDAWITSLANAIFSIALMSPEWAQAQAWPTRATTAIVPFAAGSASDVISRVVLDQVSKQIAKPIVIENRPGAGGILGANMVAKAAPDGYTMLASGALATTHALYPKLPYDTLHAFVPVMPLGQQPLVLVAAPSKGFRTVNDLVAAAKARPGKLNFASAGVGSGSHLAAERLRISAQFEAQHIPFRGATEGVTEVLAGRVDFFFGPLAPVLALINEGKLVALAVSASTRSPALSQVPTITEAGLPDATYVYWAGLFLPAKTPRDIVVRIHRESIDAVQVSTVRDRLAAIGVEPMMMGLEQFDRYFRDDVETTVRLVKAANIIAQP